MVGLINNWTEQAAKQINSTSQTGWLVEKRQVALGQLKTLSDPSRKNEAWRYADVKRLSVSAEDSVSNTRDTHEVNEKVADVEVVVVLSEAGMVVQGECPAWLCVNGIETATEKQWLDLQFDQETAVNLINTVMFQSGVLIQVGSSQQSIHLKLVYQFAATPAWHYVRNHIEIDDRTQVTVTEQHVSGQLNVVNVCRLGDAARLHRTQNIQLSDVEKFISYNQFEVSADAELNNMSHHIGGLLQHHNHVINFNSSNSKFVSGTINKSFNNNNISDIVKVNHHFKCNQSDVTHRSIAKDQSQIFNNAKALVAVGADQSEIAQDLKNILLSEDAKIFSKPELEVYADEVVAAHGSTIGALDEQSLFYLQSRGIDIEQARDIMIESFEQEALVC